MKCEISMLKMSILKRCYLFYIFIFAIFLPLQHLQAQPPQQVVILVDDSHPPYTYLHKGELTGIYVDLVKEAANLLKNDYTIKLQPIPWKRGIDSLKQGREFAILPPYKHKVDRYFISPYSIALQTEVVQAFCNPGFSLKNIEHNLLTAPPINVGLNAGFLVLDDALKRAEKQGKIKRWENKSTLSNIIKLAKKRIDCFISEKLSFQYGVQKIQYTDPEIDLTEFIDDKIIFEHTAHIGYLKDADDNYPFKDDFIEKMDKALQSVINKRNKNKH